MRELAAVAVTAGLVAVAFTGYTAATFAVVPTGFSTVQVAAPPNMGIRAPKYPTCRP